VGTIRRGRSHVFSYGRVAKKLDRAPDRHTVFEIGSITKVFTAIALADMVRDGIVKLEDPVRLYLPNDVRVPTSGSHEITLLDLATHRSGLPRMPSNFYISRLRSRRNPFKHYTPKLMYRFLSKYRLQRDVGAEFEYSNLGYGLLGHALARKVGISFEQLVIDRICKPLDLKDTCQHLSPGQKSRLAQGYTANLRPTPNWDFDALAGAGALRSTADDMLRFASANIGLVKTDLQPVLEAAQRIRNDAGGGRMKIALGWGVESVSSGNPIFRHNGGTGGYHSDIGFIKESQTAVVVLSNSTHFPDGTGTRILKLLNGGKD
jgi:CubicO group peptidase (beta-lactamase class C family)